MCPVGFVHFVPYFVILFLVMFQSKSHVLYSHFINLCIFTQSMHMYIKTIITFSRINAAQYVPGSRPSDSHECAFA